jgi:hypothetical protein
MWLIPDRENLKVRRFVGNYYFGENNENKSIDLKPN